MAALTLWEKQQLQFVSTQLPFSPAAVNKQITPTPKVLRLFHYILFFHAHIISAGPVKSTTEMKLKLK